MESFLNLLWVAIAAVVFCLWRTRWLRGRPKHHRNPLREWTAFACVLVILFFAVSLTDDLHSELVIFDECSASRRHSAALVCPHHPPQNGPFKTFSRTAILPAVASLHPLQRLGTVVVPAAFTLLFLGSGIAPGRAPPTISV